MKKSKFNPHFFFPKAGDRNSPNLLVFPKNVSCHSNERTKEVSKKYFLENRQETIL